MGTREELKKQKEKVSLTLIEAALKLCSEEGYSSLSLRSVARKANIAPTSFYRHFRDIDELGVAMVERGAIVLNEWLHQATKKMVFLPVPNDTDASRQLMTSIEQFITPFAQSLIEMLKSHRFLLRLFFQEKTGSSEALRTSISLGMNQLSEILSEHLKKNKQKMGVRDEDIPLIAETMLLIAISDSLKILVESEDEQSEDEQEIIQTRLIQKIKLFLMGASVQKQLKQGAGDE
ncbi:MAG: TetR family transcriptional regulator [Candidatus Magnetomorum sp.]|nr:TetR family transcriptional regulator [Candidatus Magnetomorum sp.]